MNWKKNWPFTDCLKSTHLVYLVLELIEYNHQYTADHCEGLQSVKMNKVFAYYTTADLTQRLGSLVPVYWCPHHVNASYF